MLRPHLPVRGYESPTFGQLAHPGQLAGELLFTGYYPVVAWLAYLIVGLALGRADLRDRNLLVAITATGLGVAVLATQVSGMMVDPALADQHATGMYGVTPADGDWSWLLMVAPHSATPFDLAQTIGSALFVIGACLLVEQALPRPGVRAARVVFGAGAMTLTLYSLHIVMRTPGVWPPEEPSTYGVHVIVLLGIGAVVALLGRRGPLETVAGLPVRLSRSSSAPGPRRSARHPWSP